MATQTAELTLENVTIEDAGAASKKITLEIGAAEVSRRLDDSMALLASSARLPGFRPGKAPKELLERRFGTALLHETRNEILRDAVVKAINDSELRVIGEAVLQDEESIKITPGEGLTVTFEVEIVPEFELPPLDAIEIRKPVVEVTGEMVDKELDVQLRRMGNLEDLDGPGGPGIYYLGRLVVHGENDEQVAELPQHVTRWPPEDAEPEQAETIKQATTGETAGTETAADLRTGAIGGIQVEQLGEKLKGKTVGDRLTIETTGPENHEVEAIRGKKIRIEFEINRVAKLIPLTMDELMARFGLTDETVIREQIELGLNARVFSEQQEICRSQILRHLLEKVEFDLPERASDKQTARTVENTRLRLLSRGIPEVAIEEQIAEIRAASHERAQSDLKTQFILERLAEDLKADVSDAELNGRIAQIAQQQGLRPEKVRKDLDKSGRMRLLANQIRHEKTLDQLVARANLTDVPADEWNAEMTQAREKAKATRQAAGRAKTPAEGSDEHKPADAKE